MALILSAGSPSIVVSSVGVGVSPLIDQRMSPRGVPTQTRPALAARHLTGRESENDRTRTGAPSPAGATLVFVVVDVVGPQPYGTTTEHSPRVSSPISASPKYRRVCVVIQRNMQDGSLV